jgi:hypothetical protein
MKWVAGKRLHAFIWGRFSLNRVGISGVQQNKDQMNKNKSDVENLRKNRLHYQNK